MFKPVKEKTKELYQEYDRYVVYNVYNEDKEFLYRETESKIKTKPDLKEALGKEENNGS